MEAPIAALFIEAARRYPGRAAIIASGAVTYAEMLWRVERRAREIQRAGPLLIMGADKTEFLVSFFAAMLAGRPALPCDAARRPPRAFAPPLPGEFYWGMTSGSTGEPKIFARTAASWIASFEACESVFPFSEHETVMIPGALSHSLFLYAAMHALARRATLLMPPRFAPKRAAAMMRDARATVLYAVPAMLGDLVAAGLPDSLKYIFCGGAKLSPDARARAERAAPGADVIEFYGASELSFVSYASTRNPAPAGSVGRLFPGVEIDFKDGVVWVRSPMLFSRYVGDAPLAPGAWATAGDMGFVDADGFLHLTGRADREINCAGRKISPEPVEAALEAHPAVALAALVGLEDAKRGQAASAIVEFRAGAGATRRELAAHLAALGAEAPKLFYTAKRLPMTRTGKVAFAVAKAELEAGAAGYEPLP